MKPLLACALFSGIVQIAAAAEAPLPPGTLHHGTLANAQLIQDAKIGVASKVATLGCSQLGDVDIYVTAMPTGTAGSRRWKELWIVSGCNKTYPVNLSFTESGNDADWAIS